MWELGEGADHHPQSKSVYNFWLPQTLTTNNQLYYW